MSHCGWNSVKEAVASSLPLASAGMSEVRGPTGECWHGCMQRARRMGGSVELGGGGWGSPWLGKNRVGSKFSLHLFLILVLVFVGTNWTSNVPYIHSVHEVSTKTKKNQIHKSGSLDSRTNRRIHGKWRIERTWQL